MISRFVTMGEEHLLKIPYHKGEGSHSSNIGYIDLKQEPDRISELHELQGYPEFEELIRRLIQPQCTLRPLRIDTAKDEFYHPQFSNSHYSFLTVSFDNPDPVDDARFFAELHGSFQSYGSHLPDSVRIDFYLVPMAIPRHKFRGWCLDIRLYGYGTSETEARGNWATGLEILNDFLIEVDNNNRFSSVR